MGRDKVAAFRALAGVHGWLDADAALPEDSQIAAVVGLARRARSTVSSVDPYRAVVHHWLCAGVGGKAIHAALCREHGYTGSYSAVARMLVALRGQQPPEVTVRLAFEPSPVDGAPGRPPADRVRGTLPSTTRWSGRDRLTSWGQFRPGAVQ